MLRLRVSPETAYHRKPEHAFEHIRRKSAAINQVTFTRGHLIDIDANQPYAQVLLEAKRAIWKHLSQG